MNKYLELDQRDGRFFEYSKDPKDGFIQHKTDAGRVSYRLTHDKGVFGTLKYINEKEDDFGTGKVLSAVLVLEDIDKNRLYLKFPIKTANGGLNEYFESLSTVLPKLVFGSEYRFYPYTMEVPYVNKSGESKISNNRGVSIHNYDLAADAKLDKVERAHSYGVKGDIPNSKWEIVVDMGVSKNVKDDKEKRNFLYSSFKNTLSPDGTTAAAEPSQVPSNSAKMPTKPIPMEINVPVDEDEEDLPF
jgi:hypothetical protein